MHMPRVFDGCTCQESLMGTHAKSLKRVHMPRVFDGYTCQESLMGAHAKSL